MTRPISAAAFAVLLWASPFASASIEGVFTYSIHDGGARITNYDKSAGSAIEIPSELVL